MDRANGFTRQRQGGQSGLSSRGFPPPDRQEYRNSRGVNYENHNNQQGGYHYDDHYDNGLNAYNRYAPDYEHTRERRRYYPTELPPRLSRQQQLNRSQPHSVMPDRRDRQETYPTTQTQLPHDMSRLRLEESRPDHSRPNNRSYGIEGNWRNPSILAETSENPQTNKNKQNSVQVNHVNYQGSRGNRRFRNRTVPNGNGDQPESQREIMDELLRKVKYECMVCCDMIRVRDRTWNCANCYNVFHLKCIQTWARKSSTKIAENSNGNNSTSGNNQEASNSGRGQSTSARFNNDEEWRCPTCQNVQRKYPSAYYCFCGQVREPETSNFHVPHSCGETCSRQLSLFNIKHDAESEEYFECNHKCTLMCHPGKCPSCSLKIERTCACNQTKMIMNCVSKRSELKCDNICSKFLDCGKHRCETKCHFGSCGSCQKSFEVKCFCGKETRSEVSCIDQQNGFSCHQICAKLLSCGSHTCSKPCHSDSCGTCPFDPRTVNHCHCGKTPVAKLANQKPRVLCTDPIPTCSLVCSKPLPCGHQCKRICHPGNCPPCDLTNVIRCECGANSQKFECQDLTSLQYKCKRRCKKKLSCGRHKCPNECCTDSVHFCQQTCGRKLECGLHTCAEPCHSFCRPCPNVIWTEVYCNCGNSSLFPPLPCNTKKPPCDRPCNREHRCQHPPTHQCHDEPQCPPCTEFVSMLCYGGHEECHTVPCYVNGVSCGRFCMRQLPCGLHKCTKVCHEGECPPCTQKCVKQRVGCQHPCNLPCHQASSLDCPESLCRVKVHVTCECEFKSEDVECHEVNDSSRYQQALDEMVRRFRFNTSITLDELKNMIHYNNLHSLSCDEKCLKEKRNRDLAEALGIDANQVGSVKYTDQLKSEARANPEFILKVHDKFVDLITTFKKSNNKTMCYNFSAMNRANREMIHNYAAFFGLKTESVDKEPNRSVIITANSASFIPPLSLLESVHIDPNQLRPKPSVVKYKRASEENKNKNKIDYFDFED